MVKRSLPRSVRALSARRFLGVGLVLASAATLVARAEQAPAADGARATPRPVTLPLRFEPNQGQADSAARFLAHGPGYSLRLTRQGATLAVGRPGPARGTLARSAALVTMHLVGGREVEPSGDGALAGETNYLLGNDRSRWRTGIGAFAAVRYAGVRPGVDLVYYGGDPSRLEYDVRLAPGVDPDSVGVAFDGAEGLVIDGEGNAVVSLAGGEQLRKRPPIAYQETASGERELVPARYRIRDDASIGFALDRHDPRRAVVIDPIIAFSTFHGGSASDGGEGIAVDGAGNIYVTGYTLSANFPRAAPLQGAAAGAYDVFVTKLGPLGQSLIYSTYLGGSGDDRGTGIAVDAAGNAYVTGFTTSANFPTVAPLQGALGGGFDGFVSKVNAAGSALVYSTYLGGANTDAAYGIGVDGAGAASVAGYTDSTNFPTSAPVQPIAAGGSDAFVARLQPSGSGLIYSTYLGGSSQDVANGIAVDGAGNAYVAGWTTSLNFPTVAPVQAALAGASDAFVCKLGPAGGALSYAPYLGGGGADVGNAIAIDRTGAAYVAGHTNSANFPLVAPLQGPFAGTYDGFVTKLDPAGAAFSYSTYLGGGGLDRANGIGVDRAGNAFVAGYTESLNFPLRSPAQAAHGGGLGDAFVSRLDVSGSALLNSTYLGGNSEDNAHAVAVDGQASVYVAGATRSLDFPTRFPLQTTCAGGPYDAFITEIALDLPKVPSGSRTTALALAGLLLGAFLLVMPRRRRA